MSLPLRRTGLNRQTRFFFSCSQCLRCCRHKKIQVNPYEIARLAANRRISTAQFIERYTHDSGTILNWEKDGACVFLDSKGCGVHPDRPLVCRLYPLGRHVLSSGEESFSEIEPDQDCRGVYGDEGVIKAYLDSQGACSFMDAADQYLELLWRLYLILEKAAAEPEKQNAIAGVFQNFAGGERNSDIGFADVDAVVAAFCEKMCMPVPNNIDGKMSIHIQAVEAWANITRRERKHEAKKTKRIATKGTGKKPHTAGD
jgi:Fe-S-cluster containining protein